MITGGAPPKIHNFISRAHEFKDTDEQIKLNEVQYNKIKSEYDHNKN